MNERKVNCFFVGCPKSGSTWLWHQFSQHPEIFTLSTDNLAYFSINYHRGNSWYKEKFKTNENEKVICDFSPSYYLHEGIAEKIYRYNPDSKIIFTIRNPIKRAYSHFKHHKRKGQVNLKFTDVFYYRDGRGLEDFFRLWIAPGFYYQRIKSYYEVFHRAQIKINLFDDLEADTKNFLQENFSFLQVDDLFLPERFEKKRNTAKFNSPGAVIKKTIYDFFKNRNISSMRKNLINYLMSFDQMEDEEQLNEVFQILNFYFKEDIEKTSELIGKDLSHWLNNNS